LRFPLDIIRHWRIAVRADDLLRDRQDDQAPGGGDDAIDLSQRFTVRM